LYIELSFRAGAFFDELFAGLSYHRLHFCDFDAT
jgi:hypothetical protein